MSTSAPRSGQFPSGPCRGCERCPNGDGLVFPSQTGGPAQRHHLGSNAGASDRGSAARVRLQLPRLGRERTEASCEVGGLDLAQVNNGRTVAAYRLIDLSSAAAPSCSGPSTSLAKLGVTRFRATGGRATETLPVYEHTPNVHPRLSSLPNR